MAFFRSNAMASGTGPMITSFQVVKQHLARWRWERHPLGRATAEGQLLVAITRFAFTSNNVTYARLGVQIPYWQFFPAGDGWGRIPVWGVGRIERSSHPRYRQGEAVYGYFPMDSHALLQPGSRSGVCFIDATPHRRELPPTYNEYVLIDRDHSYDRSHADAHLVLRPLFSLAFFCATFLKERQYFGARQVIVTSASSKTALGLAFLLSRARSAGDAIEIVGLTSSANAAFVRARAVCDRVLTYDAIGSLPLEASALIDLGGEVKLRAAVHGRLRDALRYSALAGFTHWDALRVGDASLPGPEPTLFFTPHHILRLRREWGPGVLRARLAEAWRAYLAFVDPWLRYEHRATRAGVEAAYAEVLSGKTPPSNAHILTIPAGA